MTQKAVNFEYLVETGMVDGREIENIFFADDVEEAFHYIRDILVSGRLLLGGAHVHKSMRSLLPNNQTREEAAK